MPITKSAKKKLRADKKKALINKASKTKARTAVDLAKTNPTKDSLSMAYAMLDKAAKKKVIKTGKADRLKSRLAKLLAKLSK